MAIATLVLILLALVVVSSPLARALPWLPLPFVQIALGVVAGAIGGGALPLRPEVFLFLFVPPLLFLDGWRIPNDELFPERGAVLRLAIGLVILTVLGIGALIHLMIPAMPWGVAFALAAVISPTDAVAVSSIAGSVSVPRRMMRILQGEALLNDASGLSSLRIAVAGVSAGTFSIASAGVTFLWMALGGVLIGVGVSFGAVRLRSLVGRRLGEDAGASVLSALLIPFIAYLAADRLGCSGVLAAASGGIAMSVALSTTRSAASTRVQSRAVWNMLQFALNGAMFVLLGEQLPTLAATAATATAQAGAQSPLVLAGYVVAIVAAMAALRFAWVWTSLHLVFRRPGRGGGEDNWRAVAATTVAGAKGALTLAAVLTLPLKTAAGAPFPSRDLAILIAAGVILVSLTVAAVGLPLLLKGVDIPPDQDRRRDQHAARTAAARAALAALEALGADDDGGEAQVLADRYRRRLHRLDRGDAAAPSTALADLRKAQRIALNAEREAVTKRMRRRETGLGAGGEIIRELDLEEARLEF